MAINGKPTLADILSWQLPRQNCDVTERLSDSGQDCGRVFDLELFADYRVHKGRSPSRLQKRLAWTGS
jgi:hypothetical protein